MPEKPPGVLPACRRFVKPPDAVVIVALAALTIFTTTLAVRSPLAAGAWEDDGIYLVTAKALAEGKGYRHLELPGQPFQTKYPILYPLLLSLVWRVFPDFPVNVATLQIVNGLLSGLAACLGYLLVRRAWGLSPLVAGTGVALATAHPDWVALIRMTMSEHLYTLLSLAALAVATERPPDPRPEKLCHRHTARAVGSALLASAAFLTRSIGISLVVAIIARWLFARRWREAACALLISTAAVGGWNAWQSWAAAQNSAIPQAAAFRYDLDYGLPLSGDVAAMARVAYYNATAVTLGLCHLIALLPRSWVSALDAAQAIPRVCAHLACAAVVAACAVGLVRVWRPSQSVTHLYLMLYGGLVCLYPCPWPWDPVRFLLPLLPLLFPALLGGVRWTAAGTTSLIGWQRAQQRDQAIAQSPRSDRGTESARPQTRQAGSRNRRAGVCADLGVGLAVLCSLLLIHYLSTDLRMSRTPAEAERHRVRTAAVDMLVRQTPPAAVLAGENAAYFYLMTGRHAIPFAPVEDVIAINYQDDRPALDVQNPNWPSRLRAYEHLVEVRYVAYLRRAGVTHVLAGGEEGLYAVFERYRASRTGTFPFIGQAGWYRLYAFRPAAE